jgi:glycosyltransferase involved in cell wall biosynthesis
MELPKREHNSGIMGSEYQISVALVTRNRPDSLARTLASLRAQDIQPSEIVVSDDSDESFATDTRAAVESFDATYIKGPKRGLYANRNHAALACHGTHIRTMDDDHEFPPGHVAECVKAVTEDPNSIWIIGEFKPGEEIRLPVRSPGQLNARGFSVAPKDPQNCWVISDGASIYPRNIFANGHRYAEDFKFGAAYLEFGSRLHWLGYRIRHLDSTWVIHHMDAMNRSFMDAEVDLASSGFAAFCHALIYQPSLLNRIWCFAEVIKRFAMHRSASFSPLRSAWQAYKRRRGLEVTRVGRKAAVANV